MPTYYEILNIQPTATNAEIERALDNQYNKYRRLVTHHDPNIVNQANFALQTLEKIRAILTEASKKSAYDAAIGASFGRVVTPPVSGAYRPRPVLASPKFASSGTPSTPRHLPPTQSSAPRNWTCPTCKTPNAVNSQFCKKCGESLAFSCPTCSQLVEKNAEFCTSCGINIEQAHHKIELEEELNLCKNALISATQKEPVLDRNLPLLRKNTLKSGVWSIVSVAAGLTYLFSSPQKFPGINLTGIVATLAGNTEYLSVTPQYNWLAIGAVILLAFVSIVLGLLSKVSPLKGGGAIIATILFVSLPKTLQSSLILALSDGTPQATEQATVIATNIALIATSVVYGILLLQILSHLRYGFRHLKPYYTKLPEAGCLGSLSSLLLFSIPMLYLFYLAIFWGGGSMELVLSAKEYEFYLWFINAFQLFTIGIILVGYALLSLRTTKSIENHFQQAIMQRAENIEKLTRQVQVLEQAINGINLRTS